MVIEEKSCMCCWSKICLICLFTITQNQRLPKKVMDSCSFHIISINDYSVFFHLHLVNPTFPSISFSSFFPLQERAQRFCTVCWDAAFKAAQKTKPSTATTTATPVQGTAVAKAMEVMAEHHAPWIGGWHISFWGGTGECTDII